MVTKVLSFSVIFHLLVLLPLSRADSDPVQDYCVPDTGANPVDLRRLPAYPCKGPANTTASDFVFSGLRAHPANFSPETGFSGLAVNPVQFPGLHTLGVSFARAALEAGGVNPPHYHPRATELALVVEGPVYMGFVDSAGNVFAQMLERGEVMVFPKGMIHFQMNVGRSLATIYGSFDSENPGIVRIPGVVFGSGIRDEVLEKAFGLSEKELERLRKRLGPKGMEMME